MDPTSLSTPLDAPALAAHLRLSITRLARQLRLRSIDEDLTPTQISVLVTVGARGPITVGELAEREGVASPTITKVVGILHDRGLLSKVTDPDDRRFVYVDVTAQGRKLLERDRARKNAWLARRLKVLSPQDLAILAAASEVLDRLTAEPPAR